LQQVRPPDSFLFLFITPAFRMLKWSPRWLKRTILLLFRYVREIHWISPI
jgi:hypothetical protein